MSEAPVHVASGKVRELFTIDDGRLLLVASDRISTFDVVLPTEIPDKGRVLTGLSAFWFARTRELCPNHLLGLRPDGRSTECRRLEMLPLECVVRGYLAGSGWKDYLARRLDLRARAARGPARVRPAARADLHPVDEGDERARREHRRLSRRPRSSAPTATPRSSAPRSRSTASPPSTPPSQGILIADTKFEFGLDEDGRLCSPTRRSRPTRRASGRPTSTSRAGRSPRSTSSSSATTARASAGTRPPPGPELPADVVAGTRARYVEAFERLTGIAFDDYLADPEVVLR